MMNIGEFGAENGNLKMENGKLFRYWGVLKTKWDKEDTFSLLPPQAVPLPRPMEAFYEKHPRKLWTFLGSC